MKIKTLAVLAAVLLAFSVVGSASASHPRMVALVEITPQNHTVAIYGSNFRPGSSVRFTVIDTHSGTVLARDITTVHARNYHCPIELGPVCSQTHSKAGEFDDWIMIPRSSSMHLTLRYRDGSISGSLAVARA